MLTTRDRLAALSALMGERGQEAEMRHGPGPAEPPEGDMLCASLCHTDPSPSDTASRTWLGVSAGSAVHPRATI